MPENARTIVTDQQGRDVHYSWPIHLDCFDFKTPDTTSSSAVINSNY